MDMAFNYLYDVIDVHEPLANKKNILVVEDDAFWQLEIARNINKIEENCHIDFATAADEAIGLLENDQNYSLIVADHYLEGGKTGYELWSDCKDRGIDVPFLLTSGSQNF